MTEHTLFSYSDTYVIYVDRLGTKSLIREKDEIYNNRIGLYEMSPLYLESHEVFCSVFGDDFKYFAFSDTIVGVPTTKDVNKIAIAASRTFARILDFSIAARIYVTSGDFSFHRFEQLAENPDNFICPIYGSTILDAHEMDELHLKCLGVFIHPAIHAKFNIVDGVRFEDGSPAGFLDLKHYLSCTEIEDLIEAVRDKLAIEDAAEKTRKMKDCPAIRSKEKQIQEGTIGQTLAGSVERENLNKKPINIHLRTLQHALLQRHAIVQRFKQ